jgi:uncharacterized protein
MRFLVRLSPLGIPRERFLFSVRTIARSVGAEARNPKWTSYGSMEIDVFCPTKADFDLFLAAVNPVANPEFTKDLNKAPPHRTEQELFAEARELFNSERYWECHEVLEGIWRQKQGEEKRLLQGIILVCAAYVHHQKGEMSVALGVLERAVKQLEFSRASYGGFTVARMRHASEEMLRERRFSKYTV